MAQGSELRALFVKLPNHPLLPRQNEVNSRSLILLPQQPALKNEWTSFIRIKTPDLTRGKRWDNNL